MSCLTFPCANIRMKEASYVFIRLRRIMCIRNLMWRGRDVSNATKKAIYISIYILLILGGIALKLTNSLPIKTTAIFLLGLGWIWIGISLACGLNPYYAQKYARNSQLVFAITSLGLGVAWSIISCTDLSTKAIPMILVSTPFVISVLIMVLRSKKK